MEAPTEKEENRIVVTVQCRVMTPATATVPSDGNSGQRTGRKACFKHLTWPIPQPAVGLRWAPGPCTGVVGDRPLGSEIDLVASNLEFRFNQLY